jgi:hypothetical protein
LFIGFSSPASDAFDALRLVVTSEGPDAGMGADQSIGNECSASQVMRSKVALSR